jgi:hypothetical protein
MNIPSALNPIHNYLFARMITYEGIRNSDFLEYKLHVGENFLSDPEMRQLCLQMEKILTLKIENIFSNIYYPDFCELLFMDFGKRIANTPPEILFFELARELHFKTFYSKQYSRHKSVGYNHYRVSSRQIFDIMDTEILRPLFHQKKIPYKTTKGYLMNLVDEIDCCLPGVDMVRWSFLQERGQVVEAIFTKLYFDDNYVSYDRRTTDGIVDKHLE